MQQRMIQRSPLFLLLFAAFLALSAAAPVAAADRDTSDAGLQAVFPGYEVARRALADDSLDGVAPAALELQEALESLRTNFSAQRAGVPEEKADEVAALLPEAATAAGQLAAAKDLDAARDALYALTKPLVRWRQAAGEGPAVAYCSMEKRSWLQRPGEAIGNPYSGHQMLTCGEIVSQ